MLLKESVAGAAEHMLKDSNSLWNKMVQESSKSAFESLFLYYHSRLIKYAIYWVKRKEIAEELVLDLFLKVWQRKDQLHHVINHEVYLLVGLKNLCLNQLKLKGIKDFEEIDDTVHIESFADASDRILEFKEFQQEIESCINSLPPQCQIVFRLVKDEELSYKEVADILEISPNTVHTQMVRAIKKLQNMLSHYLPLVSRK